MNWTQIGERIEGDSGFVGVQLVCLSHGGNRVVIGSLDGIESNATVKVLDFDGVTWNEVGRFSGSRRDAFGREGAVALSGDGKRLAIGAPCAGESENSYVQVYEHKEGTVWEPLGPKLIGGPNVRVRTDFGQNVSMSKDGNRIAVSSVRDVRVFELDREFKRRIVQAIVGEADWGTLILEFLGENWNQVGRSLIGGDIGCNAISADGNVVAFGSRHNRYYIVVKVFKYLSNQGNRVWIQVGERLNMVISFPQTRKYLSINAEGNLLAVSAKGGVELFRLDGDNWKSMRKISECGRCNSVCLAPDANKIAVSGEDQNGNSVKVFSHDGNEWILEANVMPPSSERVYILSVSLSSSGDRLAIGSVLKYERAHRGQVRNYKLG